jgi:acetoin utilization deacetylase AcuC-like enzyme
MKISWSKIYNHNLPKNHKFPMIKYDLLPKKLIKERVVKEQDFIYPKQLSDHLVALSHDYDYINTINKLNLSKKEERKMGFPQSTELIVREKTIMNGTLLAALEAFEEKFTFNIAGGTHHAFSDRAEGFCIFNDIAIAAKYLLKENLAKQILICDLDVHQGNGTAEICKNDQEIFTFSMHAEENYPLQKEKSDLDIGLHFETSDNQYLELLNQNLKIILKDFKPDFIFYQSGVDILDSDKFGRLKITADACKKRDEIVLRAAYENNIPLTAAMGGGYSKDIDVIVDAHFQLYKKADELLKQ